LGFTDVLFGRRKLKDASGEKLFALSTARITLEVDLGLKPAGAAAVVFKPLSAGEFVRAENELQELLEHVAQSSGSRLRRHSDEFGYEWLVLEDPDFEDLVTTAHLISSDLKARGFGPQLLASIFRFDGGKHPVYWVYSYKRGVFWPFVPRSSSSRQSSRRSSRLSRT
jgi:PspAB-like protein